MTDQPWHLTFTGNDAWQEMLAAISTATVSIKLAHYILKDVKPGKIGYEFATAFIEKARAGVAVELILDAFGSHPIYTDWKLRRAFAQAGVRLRFHTIRRTTPHPLFFFARDHRKLALVDSRVAFLGGIIIEDRARSWRDTQIRLIGPAALEAGRAFDRSWHSIAERGSSVADNMGSGNGVTRILQSGPHRARRAILNTYIEAIDGAAESVLVTSPYFVPPRSLFRALRRAAARGVAVHILVPERQMERIMEFANASFFEAALAGGMRVHLYPSYLHAKTVTVDREWASVGSCNIDRLSLEYNYEFTAISRDPALNRALVEQFGRDLRVARDLELNAWRRRPYWQRALETIGALARPML
ncbi:hypothetical protein C4552_04430 [Candidatus Parcubacteria bacterium]|nr:MAG: hypothetical protein C4552_04430 [Candidatus Parcubacteria bacterium]